MCAGLEQRELMSERRCRGGGWCAYCTASSHSCGGEFKGGGVPVGRMLATGWPGVLSWPRSGDGRGPVVGVGGICSRWEILASEWMSLVCQVLVMETPAPKWSNGTRIRRTSEL